MKERGLSQDFLNNVVTRYSNLKQSMEKASLDLPTEFESILGEMSVKSVSSGVYEEIKKTAKKLSFTEQALNIKERENIELKLKVRCLEEELDTEDSLQSTSQPKCQACSVF